MAGQVRVEELLAKAVTIDGRKEWYCRFCSEKNVCTVGVGRTRSQKLQSLQDNKKQCQKNLGKWAEDSERLRNEIEDRHAKTEVLGKNIQKESVADVELDEEIGGSQTGDEKGEEAMHLSPVEAASTQPALRDGNRTGIRANVSYAQRAHQEPWEEEENMRRSRGEERRVAKWDNQRQESVMKVSDWFCSWLYYASKEHM